MNNKVTLAACLLLLTLTAAWKPAVLASPTDTPFVYLRSWGNDGTYLANPIGVALSPDRYKIFVSNTNTVSVINRTDRTYTVLGTSGSGNGQFNQPNGIAVNSSSGNIYVVDSGNARVQEFSLYGSYLVQWGSLGSGTGQFTHPNGIAVDAASGNVYVADSGNSRVQKFNASGGYLAQWGNTGTGNGQFGDLIGVAVGSGGSVFAADSGNSRIQVFSENGTYLTQWGSFGSGQGQFVNIGGIAADGLGNIYVTDNNFIYTPLSSKSLSSAIMRVQIFSPAGAFLKQWNLGTTSTLKGIAVDSNGNMYIAEPGNNRIRAIYTSGDYLSQWGSSSNKNGQVSQPRGIAVDDVNDKVYVADAGNARIQVFHSSGAYTTQWNHGCSSSFPNYGLTNPSGVAVDSAGNIYITDYNVSINAIQKVNRVLKYNASGTCLTEWGTTGSGSGQFNQPSGITVDPSSGYVYVADLRNNRVQVFDSSGGYVTQWGSFGSGNGQFNWPMGIVVDTDGNVYVADAYNNRIQKFNASGVYLTQWGSSGSGNGQFSHPQGVEVDSNGNILVTDSGNSRIQEFGPDGSFLSAWGGSGDGYEQFNAPYFLDSDIHGAVYVVDSNNNRIQVVSHTRPALDAYSGLVQNGSMEADPALDQWAYGGSLLVSRSASLPPGSKVLQLGQSVAAIEQGEGAAWAYQTIYVDSFFVRPVLTFSYDLFVNDIMDYSDFLVEIQDGFGKFHMATIVRDGYQPCSAGTAPAAGTELGWRSVSYDLTAYKGQNIRIVFSNRNLWPISWGIWSYVDNVRILDAGALPSPLGSLKIYVPFSANQHCDPS